METFSLKTTRQCEFIDITKHIRDSLERSNLQEGFGVIYLMHTTAGLTINDNVDPAVADDILLGLDRMVPANQEGFRHASKDSDAHIKASLMGSSLTLIVEHGKLALGRWQGIFLCEFDGPRERSVKITWMPLTAKDRGVFV
jgi:secondary thiamine-phosphate synthase enzyme